MTRIVRWWSHAGFVGTERQGEIEVEDDATDDVVEEAVKDAVFNHFEWGWDEDDPRPPLSTTGRGTDE